MIPTGRAEGLERDHYGGGVARLSVAIRRLAVVAGFGVVLLVVAANLVMWLLSRGHVVSDADQLTERLLDVDPDSVVVVIPGARVHPDGRLSRPMADRVEGGTTLYLDGMAGHVLVSGDNREGHYDEPTVIRRHVHLGGVPLADISVDYAGFDTWDTCVRANEIFGAGPESAVVVFVTQSRYKNRAAALCRAAGLDAVVMTVDNPPPRPRGIWIRAVIRERLAAVKGLYEVMVKPDPMFLGRFEGLQGSETPANPDPVLGES